MQKIELPESQAVVKAWLAKLSRPNGVSFQNITGFEGRYASIGEVYFAVPGLTEGIEKTNCYVKKQDPDRLYFFAFECLMPIKLIDMTLEQSLQIEHLLLAYLLGGH